MNSKILDTNYLKICNSVGKQILNKLTGLCGKIESVVKYEYDGGYLALLIMFNNSHSVLYYNINSTNPIILNANKRFSENYEILD